MTEENNDNRPFISLSFNEEGEFDRYAGIYLHVPLTSDSPAPEEIAALIGTVKSAIKVWKQLAGTVGLAEAAIPAPPKEPDVTRVTESRQEGGGGLPPGGATDAQCKAVLAICHRLSDDVVETEMAKHAGAEWKYDKEGHLIPSWDFLKALSKQEASRIIERLGRAAS
jgi:hypothetical protein